MADACPLCRSLRHAGYHQDDRRTYRRCSDCRLVFVPPRYYLSRDDERAQYDCHQNSPHDPRYRAFLSRLCGPLLERLPPASLGLDFGSGPGPTLSVMLEEAGHRVVLYDPFYADDASALERCYDFITASEVVEHLHHPGDALNRLWCCLQPGGILGVMTKLVDDAADFAAWHYIADPTHVCFYSSATFDWQARRWKAGLTRVADDVVLFQKPE